MNILDLVILVILAFCIATSIHKGFAVSLLGLASHFCSWIISLIFYPVLSSFIISKFPKFYQQLVVYAEGATKIPVVEDRLTSLSFFSREKLLDIINETNLPSPFNKTLTANVFNVSQSQTLGQFFDEAFARVILNVICILILWAAVKLIFDFIISIVNIIKELPVLKQFDTLFSAGVGLIKGLFIVYFAFALVPLAMTIAPAEIINDYINGSLMANFFIKTNIFTAFIRAKF